MDDKAGKSKMAGYLKRLLERLLEKPDEVRISPDSFGDVWTVKGK